MNTFTFEILQWIPALLLGVGLAAASGLRAFLPLLLLAVAAHFKVVPLEVSPAFAWLGSPLALAALSVASVVEIAGDKIPLVDHFLDATGTAMRPLAATLAAAAVMQTNDPTTAALLGLVVGAPLALGVHGVKAGARGVSSATTGGAANPVISLAEDGAALFAALLSLLAPFLVPLMLACLGVVGWKMWALTRRLRAKRARASG